MTLLDYWPGADRINACVPSEAESLSDSVFLAVHQPTALFRRVMGTRPMTEPAKEADLLAWLLSPDVPEGHRVVPVVGWTGTGKSHLIRWLDIHIPRDGRHVIRIPKSSSLRRVLELVLHGLNGPAYAAIREELLRARDNLSRIAAEEGLLANFRTALRERGQAADIQARQSAQAGQEPDRALQATIDHAEGLYVLLDGRTRDALLAEGGVFRSLIDGVISGHLRPSDAATQFSPDQFRFKDVDPKHVAPGKHQKYLGRLKVQNDRDRVAAADLMNEVRDAAIYPLLGLGPGRLTELFEDVRRELLREGRELVLLIEDFVTMTGIQKSLLDVMIREGVRDGQRVLCTMRTALAVTDGTLTPWDTVRTRTKDTEWVIAELPPDETWTVDGIVNLVGAYLNAARVGAEKLTHARGAVVDATVQGWVPEFDHTNELNEQGRRQLAAFGTSARGYPLFPFNRVAVEQLARRYLRTADGQIRLNPRHVINHIIRDPLLAHQSAYLDGRFPPGNFCGFSPNELGPDVKTLLAGRAGEAFDRTAALLGFWGGLPQTPSDIRLAPEVFQTFSLEPLAAVPVQPPAPVPPAKGPQKPVPAEPIAVPPTPVIQPTGPAPPAPWPPDVLKTAMLRRWIGERIINQTDANWIRGAVLNAVDAAIDWDMELLKPPRLTQGAYYTGWVYLPQAKGGQPTCTTANALVTVCDDETFADPLRANEVELDLRAVVRFHELGHFDYDGGAIDQARYANFVERGVRQTLAFVRERYERLTGDQVPAVAQALLVSARVVNLSGAHAGDDAGQLDALLGATPHPQTLPQDDSKWSKLRRACAAERDRAVKFLLRRVGARQGGADAVYAVDAARLLAAVASTRKTWSVDATFQEGQLDEDPRMVRSFVQAVRPDVVAAAIAERRSQLTRWSVSLREWLGEEFDKAAALETLRDTVTKAVAADVFKESGDVTADRLRGLIDDFRKAAVADARDEIGRLTPDAAPGLVLSVLARVDDKVLETVDRLREAYNGFMDRITVAVVARLQTYEPDFDPAQADDQAPADDTGSAVRAMATEIDTLLEALDNAAQELAEQTPAPATPAKARRTTRAVAGGGGP